jgi:hypothetical protein
LTQLPLHHKKSDGRSASFSSSQFHNVVHVLFFSWLGLFSLECGRVRLVMLVTYVLKFPVFVVT